jgi:hypothetical protein
VRVLLAGLFGRRHPGDPVAVQWLNAATQWVAAHWTVLAVLIPVAGLIAAGVVNHYLAVARDNRARRVSRGEVRSRVYADLAARLLAHCSEIRSAIGNPRATPAGWRDGNSALRARAEMPDVIETLGREYVSFMAAIDRERRTIDAFERHGAPAREQIDRGAADVIETYVPFISQFGETQQAHRLRRFASDARARA